MNKHTPGEWVDFGRVQKCEITRFQAIGVRGLGPVAYVANPSDVPLFLAAPDLLEALKTLERELSDLRMIAVTMPRIRETIAAAIAKAEGRTL